MELTFEHIGGMGDPDREHLVRSGLPITLLKSAGSRLGLSERELLDGMGATSLRIFVQTRQKRQLSPEISRRIARLARLWWLAHELYLTDDAAREYLTTFVPILRGRPIRAVASKVGFDGAVRSLRQLANGVLA